MSKICDKCGRELPDGGLAYVVTIQVSADFDGVQPEAESARDLDRQMADLVARMDATDSEELMRDVHHSERHLLCRRCRDRFLANPLNLPLPEGRV